MTWEKLPPLEHGGLRSGCLTCGPQPIALSPDAVIAVGFGASGVTRNGVEVWSENGAEFDDCWTMQDAEDQALKDPDHDWRIFFWGPLGSATYQRHAAGQWLLVEKGQGFA